MGVTNVIPSELKKRVTMWVSGLLLSAAGLAAVVSHEGLSYPAYPDPATGGEPWTICYGHTGPEVKRGMVATQAQCDRWLAQDLKKAQDIVTSTVKVPLQQGELDAYTSFVFNVGGGNWRSSTLLRLLNQGKRQEACDQLPRWSYANKREMKGLKTRRYAERTMCLSGGAYVHRP